MFIKAWNGQTTLSVLIVAECNVNFDLKNQFCTKERF